MALALAGLASSALSGGGGGGGGLVSGLTSGIGSAIAGPAEGPDSSSGSLFAAPIVINPGGAPLASIMQPWQQPPANSGMPIELPPRSFSQFPGDPPITTIDVGGNGRAYRGTQSPGFKTTSFLPSPSENFVRNIPGGALGLALLGVAVAGFIAFR